MSKRRSTELKRCPRCRIHQALCFCEYLVPIETKNRISIIMHHREEHLTSNTATLAEKILPNAKIFMRGLLNEPFSIEKMSCCPDELTLFLYPHENALELNSDNFALLNRQKIHLIVPDGSWSQARKVYKREKEMEKITCVKLPPGLSSEYYLRKTHIAGGLSTFEAIARAVGIIENLTIENQMMAIFRIMVERVIKSRTTFHND